MKTKYSYRLLIIFSFTISITGCYTQIATREDNYSKNQDEYSYYDQEEAYDSNYVSDESDTDYEDESDADVVINKYYFGQYPSYHRYFWGYHPSIYFGFSFGNWYYDPFCWDPFYYWNWCGSAWYYPGYYYSYYNPYYYYPYYNWGYGYNYGYKNLRERTRDNYSLRNNSGLRNSYVTRGGLTGRDSRTLDKNIKSRERSRDLTLDKNTTLRNRNIERERMDVKKEEIRKNPGLDKTRNRKDDEIIRKRIEDRQNETRKRHESIFNNRSKENNTLPPRKDGIRRRETNDNGIPNIKKESSNTRQRTETKNRNEIRIERRTQEAPRSYSPPQRTYSPPTNNTPPRSYSPPSNTNRSGERRR